MSQFATNFIRHIEQQLSVAGEAADIGFHEAGYLFLAGSEGLATLQAHHVVQPAPRCPLVIDPSGVYFGPEGTGFLCGVALPEGQDPECFDFDVQHALFDTVLWPALAYRVPGFEAARVGTLKHRTLRPIKSWHGMGKAGRHFQDMSRDH